MYGWRCFCHFLCLCLFIGQDVDNKIQLDIFINMESMWCHGVGKSKSNTTVLKEAKAELESDRTIWQFQWDLKCNLPRLSIGNWLELDFGFGTSHMFHHPMSEQKQIFSELPDTEALFHYCTNKQPRPSCKIGILVRVISDCINQGCVWGHSSY